jgi:TonB family protein
VPSVRATCRIALGLGAVAALATAAGCRSAAPAPAPAPAAPPEVVEPVRPPEPPPPPPAVTVRVTGSTLNVRGGPSAGAAVVGKVRKGERLTLLEERPDWYRVQLPSGSEGWVSSRYALKEEPCLPDAAPQVLDAPPFSLDTTGAGRGRVVVQAHVAADGSVVSTKLLENSTGDAALAQQADAEVRKIRFVPPVRNCRKVAFLYNYTRSF